MIVGLHTVIRRVQTAARHRRLRVWGALAGGVGGGVGWGALVGVLGFELATAVALFAAVMGLDVGRALARAQQRHGAARDGETHAGRMVRSTAAAMAIAVAVAVVPGGIAAVRGIWTPTCDWGFG